MPAQPAVTATVQAPVLSRGELQTILAAAAMAPSLHNTQPWSFDPHGSVIDIHADFDRALLWSIDPTARQLFISCGAALLNARVAGAQLGRFVRASLLPKEGRAAPVARVHFGERGRRHDVDAELFDSVWRRHTHRAPFSPRPVPGAVLGELAECARVEGAAMVSITRSQRDWLFGAAALAEARLLEQPEYLADLRRWTGGPSSRRDGVPVSAFGIESETGSPPLRNFGAAHHHVRERQRFRPDPWVAVLSTPRDDVVSWLRAGQALQRLLLTATARGLAASFLNQPLEDPNTRRDLGARMLGGHPQMIMRLGYASGAAVTPRRPIAELISRPGA